MFNSFSPILFIKENDKLHSRTQTKKYWKGFDASVKKTKMLSLSFIDRIGGRLRQNTAYFNLLLSRNILPIRIPNVFYFPY